MLLTNPFGFERVLNTFFAAGPSKRAKHNPPPMPAFNSNPLPIPTNPLSSEAIIPTPTLGPDASGLCAAELHKGMTFAETTSKVETVPGIRLCSVKGPITFTGPVLRHAGKTTIAGPSVSLWLDLNTGSEAACRATKSHDTNNCEANCLCWVQT